MSQGINTQPAAQGRLGGAFAAALGQIGQGLQGPIPQGVLAGNQAQQTLDRLRAEAEQKQAGSKFVGGLATAPRTTPEGEEIPFAERVFGQASEAGFDISGSQAIQLLQEGERAKRASEAEAGKSSRANLRSQTSLDIQNMISDRVLTKTDLDNATDVEIQKLKNSATLQVQRLKKRSNIRSNETARIIALIKSLGDRRKAINKAFDPLLATDIEKKDKRNDDYLLALEELELTQMVKGERPIQPIRLETIEGFSESSLEQIRVRLPADLSQFFKAGFTNDTLNQLIGKGEDIEDIRDAIEKGATAQQIINLGQ